MCPEILALWGPFAIRGYGLMILIGLVVYSWLFLRDSRRKHLITVNGYFEVLSRAIIAAVVGGRLLSIITHAPGHLSWQEMIFPWEGGFSVLGSIIGVLIVVPLTLYRQKWPVLPLMDLGATYAPLLQAISRLGCFLAGCCYGLMTDHWIGIRFSDPAAYCPIGVALHPTQLYSALLLGVIFALMYWVIRPLSLPAGALSCWYVILISIERFSVDFWRADREYYGDYTLFSYNQWIALLLAGIALSIVLWQWYTVHRCKQ